MTERDGIIEEIEDKVLSDPAWTTISRIVAWIMLGLLGLTLFAALGLVLLDSRRGQSWLIERIERIEPSSGLRIGIGGIEGSLFGSFVVTDLTLSDPTGRFLEAPRVVVDWYPQAITRGRLHINVIEAPTVRLLKRPALIPSEEEQPILPDFDIYVGSFTLANLVLEEPVIGRRQIVRVEGGVDIASGRLLAALQAVSPTGGDALVARIDARPDDDRFALEGRLSAPDGGVVAGLLGLERPLVARIDGSGTWRRWTGRMEATLGDAALAELDLSASGGRFTLGGVASPGLVIGGLVRRLGSPSLRLDARAGIAERRINAEISAVSPSLDLDAAGIVDLARGRFENFAISARLTDPKALVKTMTASAFSLKIAFDGPLSTPAFDYRLTADWLALSTTRLDKVLAVGKGRLPTGEIRFPVDIHVARVTGVGEFVEELATNARLTGALSLDGAMIGGTGLALKTDKVVADVDIRFDTRTGAYDVDADGRVPRYAIEGFGLVDVAAQLNFIPEPSNPRQLRIRGKTSARVTRLDVEFLEWLSGGLPAMTATIDRAPSGTVVFSDARLVAPDLTISGKGSYALGQQIDFAGSGVSQRFGPLDVKLSGLVSRPLALVRLDSYSAGIVLSNVAARFVPGPEAYVFDVSASSVAGPVTARGRIVTAPATVFEVDAITIAGLEASGRLLPVDGTAAVNGTLAVSGPGISGSIRMSPEAAVQRFDANLNARSGRLATPAITSIRRGSLSGTLILAETGADVSGRFDLEGVTQGALLLRSAKGTIELKDGDGSAVLIAAGERGTSFTLDLAASLQPDRVLVTSRGSIARQPFALATPAIFTAVADGWRLAPTVLNLPEGSARISGTFGDTISLSTDLTGAGLELFDLALPGMGFTGKANGRVVMTFPPGGLPRGSAKLRVSDFTRVTGSFSVPVDMAVVALLEPDKAVVRAAFNNDGQRLGILQGRLSSIPGGINDPWIERLAGAALTAQLRWRGPAEMLWPLTGVEALSIRGNVAVSLDIGGILGDPVLKGLLRSRAARVESAITGTAIENIRLEGRFTGSRLELTEFAGTAGKGSINGSGHVDLSFARGFPIDLALSLKQAQMLNRDDLRAIATGPLRIRNDPSGAIISGDLEIDSARFRIGRTAQTEIPQLRITETNTELVRAQAAGAEPAVWQFDVRARGRRSIEVRGMGLTSDWTANLAIKGSANAPRITGTAELIRGDYEFAGRRFELTRGELRFTGEYPPDPVIDIAAEARVDGLTATIAIRGTGQRPEINFSSIPALPQDEVLSRVLFGTSITNLSAPEALQLAGAVASLQGGGGGLNPINAIRSAVGLDRLRVIEGNSLTGQGTSVAAGEYLTNRVYVEVATDAQGYTATQLEIELTRALSVLSQVATLGGTSINLKWSKDY